VRPIVIHVINLAGLCILGFTLLAMEALSPHSSGGLIKQYTFTKLYWLGLCIYTLITTTIVLFVGVYKKIKNNTLAGSSVVLSHVIRSGWHGLLSISDYMNRYRMHGKIIAKNSSHYRIRSGMKAQR